MVYVLAVGGVVQKYPYTLTDLRRDNPEVSFPSEITNELAAEFNVFSVEDAQQPDYVSETEALVWVNPTFQGGKWIQQWSVDPLSQSEISARLENWRQAATCTPFQGRMALSNAGKLADVETAISAADEKTRTAWEYALIWQRNSPMIETLGAALGMTDAEIDDLFKAANQITA